MCGFYTKIGSFGLPRKITSGMTQAEAPHAAFDDGKNVRPLALQMIFAITTQNSGLDGK